MPEENRHANHRDWRAGARRGDHHTFVSRRPKSASGCLRSLVPSWQFTGAASLRAERRYRAHFQNKVSFLLSRENSAVMIREFVSKNAARYSERARGVMLFNSDVRPDPKEMSTSASHALTAIALLVAVAGAAAAWGQELPPTRPPAAASSPLQAPIAAGVVVRKNGPQPCIQPAPLVRWQDYQGPFQKTVGAFGRQIGAAIGGPAALQNGSRLVHSKGGGQIQVVPCEHVRSGHFCGCGLQCWNWTGAGFRPELRAGCGGLWKSFRGVFS